MSQNTLTIADGTGLQVLGYVNNALNTLVTQNSGSTAPTTTYAYMTWADTTTGLLKIRNAANTAWVTVGTMASTNLGLVDPTTATTFSAATTFNSGTLKLAGSTSGTATLNPPAAASTYTYTLPAVTGTLAALGLAQTWTVSQRGTVTTDNDGSFAMTATNNFKCTPTANFALTFTSITAGQSGFILLVNTGGYTVTAAATTKVSANTLSTISTAGTYLLSYFTDGTNVYVTATGAMA